MSGRVVLQLFGVTSDGPVALPVAEDASGFEALYTGLNLGVYTAFRSFRHNRFLDLGSHIERTRRSMSRLGMDHSLDVARLRQALHEVCTAYPGEDMRIRIDVLAESASLAGFSGRELIALAPFTAPDPRLYSEGARVITTTALSRDDPLTKTADFVTARRSVLAAAPEAEECLLVDSSGHVLEGASSNFYAVVDGTLRTAGEGVLEGVTRNIVLQVATQKKVPLVLHAVARDELSYASEAAISSSSRGLMPVVSIDALLVGKGVVGPVMSTLMRGYEDYLSDHLKLAVQP